MASSYPNTPIRLHEEKPNPVWTLKTFISIESVEVTGERLDHVLSSIAALY